MTKEIKDLAIRNSTAEFLIFTAQSGEESIEVKYEGGTVWLSQKMMAKLFDVTIPTINEHLRNIYQNQELEENSTIRKFRIVQNEGARRIALAHEIIVKCLNIALLKKEVRWLQIVTN